jgi:hypothetical protein
MVSAVGLKKKLAFIPALPEVFRGSIDDRVNQRGKYGKQTKILCA